MQFPQREQFVSVHSVVEADDLPIPLVGNEKSVVIVTEGVFVEDGAAEGEGKRPYLPWLLHHFIYKGVGFPIKRRKRNREIRFDHIVLQSIVGPAIRLNSFVICA